MTLTGDILSLFCFLVVIILHYFLTSEKGKSCLLSEKGSASFKMKEICYCHLHNEGLPFNKKYAFSL